jgi:hypothetical protein
MKECWCKLLEKPPMQAPGTKNLFAFSIPQRCTRRRTRTVARMEISCRGRAAAFLPADLKSLRVHLPHKRASDIYILTRKMSISRRIAKQRGDKVSELNERQAQMNCDARKKRRFRPLSREKSQLRKELAAVSKFLAPHDKSGWSICFEYILFHLSPLTAHNSQQRAKK